MGQEAVCVYTGPRTMNEPTSVLSHSPQRERSPTMPHQWQRETNHLLDTARRVESHAAKQRFSSSGVQKVTADRVVQDSVVSNSALRRKIDESNMLKAKAEAQLDAVVTEMEELELESARAENVLEIMKDPLAVAE